MKLSKILALVCASSIGLAAAPLSQKETARRASSSISQTALAEAALFEKSDLEAARRQAASALKKNASDAGSLFVEMEAAALQADTAAVLEAALRLCELSASRPDNRVNIAAARVLDLAANSSEFRRLIPRVQKLVASETPQVNFLRAALVAAAADGANGLSLRELAQSSGIVTEWRIAGPFGRYPNVDFDGQWPPQQDGLSKANYGKRPVERFQFEDGNATLPDYFAPQGVFFAASEIEVKQAGDYRLRIESAGTMKVFVDGAVALHKDDRFRASAEIVHKEIRLAAGKHSLLLKFLRSAMPFRLAVLPTARVNSGAPPLRKNSLEAESPYVAAAAKYWAGDYSAAINALSVLREKHPSAPADFLLALAWSHAAPDPGEQTALLASALKRSPSAWAAEYALAARSYGDEHVDDALARLRRVAAARPQSVPAAELMAEIALRLSWRSEAAQVIEHALRLHPSCVALRKAEKFFVSASQYDRAGEVEVQLNGCAPASLSYAQSLSETGRHRQAATAAAAIASAHPLDREARALLTRELALDGQFGAALQAAEELHVIAPNSERFRRLAAQNSASILGSLLEDEAPRGAAFAKSAPFYGPYRRDPLKIIRDTAERRFSGGPMVMLLQERVAELGADDRVSLYVHKIIRVLNREGIEQYGEVALPKGADVLELRTVKADGTVAEPDFTQHKSTISMPALAPGAVIEEEYVLRHPDRGGVAAHSDAFEFIFGSFSAPILYSRFVVLSPAQSQDSVQVVASGKVPTMKSRLAEGVLARSWEQNEIPQSFQEASLPRADNLPAIRLLEKQSHGWNDMRDYYRDLIIDATRIGSRTLEAAGSIHCSGALHGGDGEEGARKIYNFVAARIRPAADALADGEISSAEDSLGSGEGSRTATFLALAKVCGVNAELVLAREADTSAPQVASREAYTRPLVCVRCNLMAPDGLPAKILVLDLETEGMVFGGISPTLAREDALLVPSGEGKDNTAARADLNPLIALPQSPVNDQSVAEADITLDDQGSLAARVHITMGASRGAQMRSLLRGIEPGARGQFFQQLAMRIFSGAIEASGEVLHEAGPDPALELIIQCRAPHFLAFTENSAHMQQLVPTLGLNKMYGGSAVRRFPLYIDAPLFEDAIFRLHFAGGIRLAQRPEDLEIKNRFGSYAARFRQTSGDTIQIRRRFQVPVQVVRPENFEEFRRFALRIDETERQRLGIERFPSPTALATR